MESFPGGWGLVGFNDLTGRILPTHWVADKLMLNILGGEFFHTGYIHCYCDNELMERSIDAGRYIYSQRAIVKHYHPLLKSSEFMDEHYKFVYSKNIMKHDEELYKKRQKGGWK